MSLTLYQKVLVMKPYVCISGGFLRLFLHVLVYRKHTGSIPVRLHDLFEN